MAGALLYRWLAGNDGLWHRRSRALPPTVRQQNKALLYAANIMSSGTAITDPNYTLGTTRPVPGLVGVTTGSTLTAYNGNLVCAANTTYQNLDIFGFVTGATNATLVNCRVRGGSQVITGLVTNTAPGFTVSRCTLVPDNPRYYLNGVNGGNTLVDRCEIYNVVDGIHATSDNMRVHGTYIHDLAFFDGSTGSEHASDSRFPGWTHNDGVQWLGGSNHEVIGCWIMAYFSATVGTPQTAITGTSNGSYPNRNYSNGITVTPNSSNIVNWKIQNNWIEGGEIGIQVPTQGTGHDTGNDGDISGNRFGTDQHPYGTGYQQIRYSIGIGNITGLSPQTNTYDNVGSVQISLRGQSLPAPVSTSTQPTYQQTYLSTGFYLGRTQPNAANTGVPSGTTLTNVSGDIIVTDAWVTNSNGGSRTIQNLRVAGRIVIQTNGITVQYCEVLGSGAGGPGNTGNTAVIDCQNSAVLNAVITQCTLHQDPATANLYNNGVTGHDYTATRNNVYDVCDGFGALRANNNNGSINVTIQGNYIHDLGYFTPDPNHSDNHTHNDGVQVQSGSNTSIIGNNIVATASTAIGQTSPYAPAVTGQCITITPNAGGPITGLTIDANWANYGSRQIVAITGAYGGSVLGTCINNRLGPNANSPTVGIQIDTVGGLSWSQYGMNFWIADGSIVTLKSGTG